MTPDRMAEIHAASFTTPRPWAGKEFADLLSSNRTHVATSADGFALIQIAGPEAELLTIAVHPNGRRQGQGTLLLTEVLDAAKAAHCEEFFLEVVADNVAAIALYKSVGFTERAVRKDYYDGPNGSKSSALLLYKSL